MFFSTKKKGFKNKQKSLQLKADFKKPFVLDHCFWMWFQGAMMSCLFCQALMELNDENDRCSNYMGLASTYIACHKLQNNVEGMDEKAMKEIIPVLHSDCRAFLEKEGELFCGKNKLRTRENGKVFGEMD